MSLLKQKYWYISLILTLCVGDVYSVILAYMLDLFDKDAWYTKWYYWFLGVICLVFPVFIMFAIFEMQMLVKVCEKLSVPGSEIYGSVYTWILCLIVPIIGWILLLVMYIYLNVWKIVMLYKGEGEKNGSLSSSVGRVQN